MTPLALILLGLLITTWSVTVTYANLMDAPELTALHHEDRSEYVTREVAEDARLRQGETDVTIPLHLQQKRLRSDG